MTPNHTVNLITQQMHSAGWLRHLTLVTLSIICLSANAMNFELQTHDFMDNFHWVNAYDDLVRVYATGEINQNSGAAFERFVKQNKLQKAIVFFNSGGGSLVGAIELGTVIRRLRFDTGIALFRDGATQYEGICASACVYAFAGGVSRYYKAGGTRLGLHQFYATDNSISNEESQKVSGILVAYLQNMGVDALAFSVSSKAVPEEIVWLSADDALRLKFANNGERPATAELKLQYNITYLKIEQERSSGTSRFLFDCLNKEIVLTGGMVADPEKSKNTFDWATRSFFTFGKDTIQEERKENNPTGITVRGSVVWVNRTLKRNEVQKLLASDLIGTWVAGDGFMSYGALASINNVKGNIQDFVSNCLK